MIVFEFSFSFSFTDDLLYNYKIINDFACNNLQIHTLKRNINQFSGFVWVENEVWQYALEFSFISHINILLLGC